MKKNKILFSLSLFLLSSCSHDVYRHPLDVKDNLISYEEKVNIKKLYNEDINNIKFTAVNNLLKTYEDRFLFISISMCKNLKNGYDD